jgi:hypothetical protein
VISGTVSGIIPGSAGCSWPGRVGGGSWVSVRSRSKAAVTVQAAREHPVGALGPCDAYPSFGISAGAPRGGLLSGTVPGPGWCVWPWSPADIRT